MIDIKTFMTEDTYFAARNGHRGFESLFGKVFAPEKYNKIFILKGGPGTGKSTLMRGIVSLANENSIACEAILCSSDPSSLDGVILESKAKRAAILDGTAPHATDPKYPGAVEEIINLGDGFDTRALEAERSEIIDLSKIKSAEYSHAYSALCVAHGIFNYIWGCILNSSIYTEAEKLAKELKADVTGAKNLAPVGEKIYSAFGKDGYKRLPLKRGNEAVAHGEKRLINIGGDPLLCAAFMHALDGQLASSGELALRAPSALDSRILDRLYTADTVIASREDGEVHIDLSCYSLDKAIPHYAELYRSYTDTLAVAASHFRLASTRHFELEDIYSSAVDFGNNDKVFSALAERLLSILSILA